METRRPYKYHNFLLIDSFPVISDCNNVAGECVSQKNDAATHAWKVQNEIVETSTINSDHAAIDRISYTCKRVDIGKKQWDIYLEFVQSSYSVSNSLGAISLHLLTPGWMAPIPRRMRTCSTLQTMGKTSSLFNLV